MPKTPFFSIIIPTYNRPDEIKHCLDSVRQLRYPKHDFEVIVVDDGGHVNLENTINLFRESISIRLILQENSGPGNARNNGARNAQGEYLVFIDDDCLMAPDYLTIVHYKSLEHPNSVLGGHSINILDKNIYSSASQLLVDYIYSYYNSDHSNSRFLTSNNLVVPKRMFAETGGFDSNFHYAAAEDREFCRRWRNSGYTIIYAKEAIIYHAHNMNFIKFWRQHFNYGRGAFLFHRITAQNNNAQIKMEPMKFYIELLRFPLKQEINQTKILLFLLLGLSQMSNVSGFFYQKILT